MATQAIDNFEFVAEGVRSTGQGERRSPTWFSEGCIMKKLVICIFHLASLSTCHHKVMRLHVSHTSLHYWISNNNHI